jgi:ribosomal protein L2
MNISIGKAGRNRWLGRLGRSQLATAGVTP